MTSLEKFREETIEEQAQTFDRNLIRCNWMLQQNLSTRKIEFLLTAMRKYGCDVDKSIFQCVLCGEDDLGGLDLTGKPRIPLCCNYESLINDKTAFLADMTHHL